MFLFGKPKPVVKEGADICVIGVGAAGSVLAAKLAEAGFSVVGIEAGKFWQVKEDFVSDEREMSKLYWLDERLTGGDDAMTYGKNNSGIGVGGGTVHFVGFALRFHEDDFKVKSTDGIADDWPIEYRELAPYYDEIEKDFQVSGPEHFPWGAFKGPYPQPEHPSNCMHETVRDGCEKIGVKTTVGPIAIKSLPHDEYPPCTYRGMCKYGCLPNAKSSGLIVYAPRAIRAGATIIDQAMVTRINLGKNGRVGSVTYIKEGKENEQKAKIFILSGYAVETPRLLLNSKNDQFPDGLANSSGLVGKRLMPHSADLVYGLFDREIRQYKGPQGLIVSQDFYQSDFKKNGFYRGYTLEDESMLPVEFAETFSSSQGFWGEKLKYYMNRYNYFASFGPLGEVLPNENNRIELSDEKDRWGMYKAHSIFGYGENDKKIVDHGVNIATEALKAAGAIETFRVPSSAHILGTCRMGNDPNTSVVNSWHQSHDIRNLYICDGSVFVTSAAVNPSFTIMALASRLADNLAKYHGQISD